MIRGSFPATYQNYGTIKILKDGMSLKNRDLNWKGFTGLETTRIAHYIAGPSTYTPDGQFVLGSVPDIDGFLVATGYCGSGIGSSGGIGRAIAELAIGGETGFYLESFRIDRFGRIDVLSLEWMQHCADARSNKD